MEAARSSETFVNFYQTTLRYNPEDSHLLILCSPTSRVDTRGQIGLLYTPRAEEHLEERSVVQK
jgi:hypothetical protein